MAKAAAKKTKAPKTIPGVSAEEAAKLAGLIAALEKQHGEGIIMLLDGPPTIRHYSYQVPTGSIGLDIAIGPMRKLKSGTWQTGDIPGTITECYGPEGSGKTTLMLMRIANYQAMGLRCAMVDMEHALDPHYAKRLGVDMTKLYWVQPKNGEQALQITETLLKSGLFAFVGVDSVAALIPKSELEGEIGDSSMGSQARMMSQAMRHIVPAMGAGIEGVAPPALFFTNQIRMKIGKIFGSPETQPGGNALKYAAHFRIDVRKGKSIVAGGGETEDEGNAQIVGQRLRMKIIKNKVSPPFRVAEASLIYGAGVDTVEELFDLCVINGIIIADGSWYTVVEGSKIQGKKNAVEYMRTDRMLCYSLYDRLMTKNMASLGLNPDGTVMEGVTMESKPTNHAQFEPPTAEELEFMTGQETPAEEGATANGL
jgi:recombination protein RecA